MLRLVLSLAVLCVALPVSSFQLVEENGFRVPAGFGVQLYADDTQAHDISCLTFDSLGRVVVSGPGYIKTLIPDENAPPQAPKSARAITFSELPKSGAQGLCFVGRDLFASGDSAVWKFHDANADGIADGPPEKFIDGLKAGGEHGVHAIVQGPDGWLYVIGGDGSGISDKLNTIPTASIKASLGGAILRVSLDGTQREIIAHGFRNPYAMCFNALGSIFAWDSDGERVDHLPGYRSCSLFDVGRGRHHGWVNTVPGNPFSRPWQRPDVVDPLIQIGRGSPTGVVCYRHRQFPAEWQDGIFFACWTFGRVYFCNPVRKVEQEESLRQIPNAPFQPVASGAGYIAEKQVFLESVGNQGFAPSALAIGPDGALYVASGGRGTKGSVYRIAHKTQEIHEQAASELEQILAADQSDAAWSRGQWVAQAQQLGGKPFKDWLLRDSLGLTPKMDIRALEILTELFGGVRAEIGAHISAKFARDDKRLDTGRELLARLAWAGERNPRLSSEQERNDSFWAPATVAGGAGQRAASEAAMMQHGRLTESGTPEYLEQLSRGMQGGDQDFGPLLNMYRSVTTSGDILLHRNPQWDDGYLVANPKEIREEIERNVDWWTASKSKDDWWTSQMSQDDWEYARLVAITQAEPAGFWESLPKKWTAKSEVREDLHYLFVAARRSKAHENVQPIADAWLRLHHKLRERNQSPSRAWPEMVGDAFAAMLKQTPALADAIINSPQLNLPEHALFLEKLEGDAQRKGVFKLTNAVKEWTPELVKLATAVVLRVTPKLPNNDFLQFPGPQSPGAATWSLVEKDEELLGVVDRLLLLAENPALRDSVLIALPEWAFTFHESTLSLGLESYQPAVVKRTLDIIQPSLLATANSELAAESEDAFRRVYAEDCRRLLLASRRFFGQPSQTALVERLQTACWAIVASAKEKSVAPPPQAKIEAAFRKCYPEQAKALDNPLLANIESESTRWSKLDPTQGDTTRGKLIYEQRQCARCHSGNARMGPDLKGVAQRWSLEDLFLQIADPNRSISPAWKGERFLLKDGREYSGVAVYDSPVSMLVQISPDETVRITGTELRERTPSPVSLMPPSLLLGLSDTNLADLHAYLRTLK